MSRQVQVSHGDRQTHNTKNNTVTAEMGHCKVAAPSLLHTFCSVWSLTHTRLFH